MIKSAMSPWSALSTLSLRSSFLLMLLAGGMNVLSFAPFNFWPVQVLSMALLFTQILREGSDARTPKQAALLAWAYAFAWLAATVCWLVIAMTRFGGLPWVLSSLALALLSAAMAIYAAAAAWLAQNLRQRWGLGRLATALLLLPALLTLAEWLRIAFLTGFPWTISGYAHTTSPLAGFAPLIGVLGLGWLNAMLAAVFALLFMGTVSRTQKTALTGFALAIFALGVGLQAIEWTTPYGKPLQVRLLQGNVAQDMKFEQDHLNESLALYHDMLLAAPADLVVTPETALPMLTSQLPPDYLPALNAYAQRTGIALLVGVGVYDGGDVYSNSVLGLSPQYADKPYRYDKHHLVPFGEFIPPGFRWFVKAMAIPMGEFSTAGPIQPAMKVKDQLVMPNICYEDLFGEEIAAQLSAQHAAGQPMASILLNASNLAWYGESYAIAQHLQISQMRVLETGRPMLRATNTGATAFIVPGAKVEALMPVNTKGSLSVTVQGRQGMTPYILLGNASVLLLALLSILLAFWLGRRHVKAIAPA